MSHTYRVNPETHEEEVERRHLRRKIEKQLKEKSFKDSFLYQPDEEYEMGSNDESN
jgi:hypothetical protein